MSRGIQPGQQSRGLIGVANHEETFLCLLVAGLSLLGVRQLRLRRSDGAPRVRGVWRVRLAPQAREAGAFRFLHAFVHALLALV